MGGFQPKVLAELLGVGRDVVLPTEMIENALFHGGCRGARREPMGLPRPRGGLGMDRGMKISRPVEDADSVGEKQK